MLRSNIKVYSDSYLLDKGRKTIAGEVGSTAPSRTNAGDKQVAFNGGEPFIDFTSEGN